MEGTSEFSSSGHRLDLPPGFRFHPTDEELVVHYLKRKVSSRPLPVPIIAEIDLYKFDPWDLPAKAVFGEHEWYFFTPRDRKYPNGARPNRAAASGYWKATGTDKPIILASGSQKLGVKKALVFYKGRPPKGLKTNWIMHEYRLVSETGPKPISFSSRRSLRLDDWVLCRIYTKSGYNPRLDISDSSCVEEVLASLPDMDEIDATNGLPTSGSLGKILMGVTDPYFNNLVVGSASQVPHAASGNMMTLQVESSVDPRNTWNTPAQFADTQLFSSHSIFMKEKNPAYSRCPESASLMKLDFRRDEGNKRINLPLGLPSPIFPNVQEQKAQSKEGGNVVNEISSSLRWPFADSRCKFLND